MKCWIIYNAYLDSDKFVDFARMLGDAAVARGYDVHIKKNSDFLNVIESEAEYSMNHDTAKPDFVLFTDKDIYLAHFLEAQGIPVYNSAHVIEDADDKIKTYQILAQAGVPIPRTIVIPKTFGHSAILHDSFFDEAIQTLGLPLVVKESFGSFGEQVHLATNRNEVRALVTLHGHKPLMLQEFIKTSYGRDIRIQVVGEHAVAAMKRSADDDFRANITAGGKMIAYEPNIKEINIAVKASKTIGAHFSGVDLLFGPNGCPVVCEVNTNAHIRNLLDCTGVNAAIDIICYIEQHMKARDCS